MCTTDPGYYRWTQWIFLQLFRRGLAYQAEVPVNWCPALGTVLANEEVIDGRSERGSHPVVRLPMKQARPRKPGHAVLDVERTCNVPVSWRPVLGALLSPLISPEGVGSKSERQAPVIRLCVKQAQQP